MKEADWQQERGHSTSKKQKKESMLLSGEVNFWLTSRKEKEQKRKSVTSSMEARHKTEALDCGPNTLSPWARRGPGVITHPSIPPCMQRSRSNNEHRNRSWVYALTKPPCSFGHPVVAPATRCGWQTPIPQAFTTWTLFPSNRPDLSGLFSPNTRHLTGWVRGPGKAERSAATQQYASPQESTRCRRDTGPKLWYSTTALLTVQDPSLKTATAGSPGRRAAQGSNTALPVYEWDTGFPFQGAGASFELHIQCTRPEISKEVLLA